MFDDLIIAVGKSPIKNAFFSPEERVEMIKEILAGTPRVSVEAFDGLMVDFARRKKADVILRGIRSLTDFQYEFRLGNDKQGGGRDRNRFYYGKR